MITFKKISHIEVNVEIDLNDPNDDGKDLATYIIDPEFIKTPKEFAKELRNMAEWIDHWADNPKNNFLVEVVKK